MFKNIKIFKRRCLFCNNNEIIRYNLCSQCLNNIIDCRLYYSNLDYIDNIEVCAIYNSFIKELMIEYKYNDKTYISRIFGEMILEKIVEKKMYINMDYISFIPSAKGELSRKGYNQSKILAEYIGKNLNFKIENLLIKTRRNKKQKDLNRYERFKNVEDIFISDRVLNGKNILLIDDVVTTGYTLDFAAKALKSAGAKRVAAITVATRQNS